MSGNILTLPSDFINLNEVSSHRASCSSDISVDLSDAFQSMRAKIVPKKSKLLKDVRFKYLFVTFHCTFAHKRDSEVYNFLSC
ncbi:unnamed protein product [Schistosoma intercalatum]|nr:unnamed protein product [Schistosoma intercalatum]